MSKRSKKRLFGPADDWWHNACLNYLPDHLDAYATGYKEAADVLVAEAMETRRRLDLLVYPILFLYRHYLELRLKNIIQEGNRLLGRRARFPRDHRLDHLWAVCRRIIEEVWPGKESKSTIKSINGRIREFARVDPTSEAFRYSTVKDGKKSLLGITHINLRQVRDEMDEVAKLLDAASFGISAIGDEDTES